MRTYSGRYRNTDTQAHEEFLHVDIDGPDALMKVSGTIVRGEHSTHWIADILNDEEYGNVWMGQIWYKEGFVSDFLYTEVRLKTDLITAEVIFINGPLQVKKNYLKISSHFRRVEFTYAVEGGVIPVRKINTHCHNIKNEGIRQEDLSIEDVFLRAGVAVQSNPQPVKVHDKWMRGDGKWSDRELHDAMQSHWSRFDKEPTWALWVMFGKEHEDGENVGGVMFDKIGPRQRQGTAIFNESFINAVPAIIGNSPEDRGWIDRMKFFTACHEIGHAFNLAHSNEKRLTNPWIALRDETDIKSFMNNPKSVGYDQFFRDFEYKFSETELTFLRHAPEQFVQMGKSNWTHHHGLVEHPHIHKNHDHDHENHESKQAEGLGIEFRISTGKPGGKFEFMEPVNLEMEVINHSNKTKTVPLNMLQDERNLEVFIHKSGKWMKRKGFARHVTNETTISLNADPDKPISDSLFISAGAYGWMIEAPGEYLILAKLKIDGHVLISNSLKIHVQPPNSYKEQKLAYDYFTDEVARVLTFNGSRVLTKATDHLQEVTKQMKKSKASVHARIALALPFSKEFKEISKKDGKTITHKEEIEIVRAELEDLLIRKKRSSEITLGPSNFNKYSQILRSLSSDKFKHSL